MSSEGSRLLITLFCLLGFFGGCAGVPAAPPHAQNAGADDDEGWLFRRLTGQTAKPAAERQPAAAVAATSPPTAPSQPLGPMIPGPSSPHGTANPSATELIPSPPNSPAGPPPTIPEALPPPPDGGVSINSAKIEAEKQKNGIQHFRSRAGKRV